jgi:hypothetical protein
VNGSRLRESAIEVGIISGLLFGVGMFITLIVVGLLPITTSITAPVVCPSGYIRTAVVADTSYGDEGVNVSAVLYCIDKTGFPVRVREGGPLLVLGLLAASLLAALETVSEVLAARRSGGDARNGPPTSPASSKARFDIGWVIVPAVVISYAVRTFVGDGAYGDVNEIPSDPASSTEHGHFGLGWFAVRSAFADGVAAEAFADLKHAIGRSRIECSLVNIPGESVELRVRRCDGDLEGWVWNDGSVEKQPVFPSAFESPEALLRESMEPGPHFDASEVPWSELARLGALARQRVSSKRAQVSAIQVRPASASGGLRISFSVDSPPHSVSVTFDERGQLVE